ncbi:thiamine-phosphate synthase family protein [Methanopyrus sp. SNP6]|uniref:thiamine-phosphate synthase family protein n=1 Tax=Methanopyrus sp. SNP6 TaxID=1937005 RepID=UPI0011E5F2B7|nr:thiamine-phosphate synthase family protein [Methanopyrus sp. SNP6]
MLLIVAGHDPTGAGLRADVVTAGVLGIPAISLPTLLSLQDEGVELVEPVDSQFLSDCLARYVPRCEVVKVGAVPTLEIFEILAKRLRNLTVVWDPVFRAEAGGVLSEATPEEALETFGETVDIITPNTEELSQLVGRRIRTTVEAELAARELVEEYSLTGVLVTGGHSADRLDVWVPAEGDTIAWEMPPGEGAHGSGCVLSTALACFLARGLGPETAVERAVRFARAAVRKARNTPFGRVVDPAAQIRRDAALGRAMQHVIRALEIIESDPTFARAIPQVGMNVAEVFDPSMGLEGVIGLSGRIVLDGDEPSVVGYPVPGGSKHVGTVALTAHRLDPSVRAAVNASYNGEFIERARDLGFVVSSFDRSEEPEEIDSTMEWGTEVAFRKSDDTPDVIYDEGDVGKEPMIRVLGRSAVEAVTKLRMLLG